MGRTTCIPLRFVGMERAVVAMRGVSEDEASIA